MNPEIKAFQDIVLGLPARDRRKFSSQIQLLQSHFGDKDDLISPRYGHHFSLRSVTIESEADGEIVKICSHAEAAAFFSVDETAFRRQLTLGKGQCTMLIKPTKAQVLRGHGMVEYTVYRS